MLLEGKNVVHYPNQQNDAGKSASGPQGNGWSQHGTTEEYSGDTTILGPNARLLLRDRKRSALLTGLLKQGDQTVISPEVSQLIIHREQKQQSQTRLLEIIQQQQDED